jgi:hypothetical protein
MFRRLSICLVLSLFAVGVAFAQVNIKAAARNTWHVAGLLGMGYNLPTDTLEGTDSEDGSFNANFSPRVLYFPIDGLGVGADANLAFSANYIDSTNVGIGPRVAFYLRSPLRRYPSACCLTPCVGPDGWWMPNAGVSFLYLMNSTKYGESDPNTSNGWRLKVGVGVSPVIGTKGTMPVELGFMTESITREIYEGETETNTSSRIYLEAGFGAFLWK